MQPEFWKAKWQAGQIGFHSDAVHIDLIEYSKTWLADGPHRILVPLCGKSVDLAWMTAQGHEVIGIELVKSAVVALFEAAGLAPTWHRVAGGECARAGRLTVYCGNLFELSPQTIGPVTRIWDRAAFIALHPDQRAAYSAFVQACAAPNASLLMNVLHYDPAIMDGPPWSVDADVVAKHYPQAALHGRRDALDDRWKARGHRRVDAVTWQSQLNRAAGH